MLSALESIGIWESRGIGPEYVMVLLLGVPKILVQFLLIAKVFFLSLKPETPKLSWSPHHDLGDPREDLKSRSLKGVSIKYPVVARVPN